MLTLSATFSGLILAISLSDVTPCASKSWDYFTLALEWPSVFCMEKQCKRHPPEKNTWTIHGLWPTQTDNHMCPRRCDNSTIFNSSAVKSLESDLDKYWPDLLRNKLWKGEWAKHGTCAMPRSDPKREFHYFQKALELTKRFAIYQTLQENGITPGNKPYKLAQIEDALLSSAGQPKLSCFRENLQGKTYLSGMDICMDKSLVPQSCAELMGKQQYLKSSCSRDDDVYYPSETPDEYP